MQTSRRTLYSSFAFFLPNHWTLSFRIWLLIAPLCLLLGALIGVGAYPFVIALIGGIGVCCLVAAPHFSVWITIVGAIVVSGMVELYLPSFQMIRWGFSALGLALGVVVIVRSQWTGGLRPSRASAKVLLWAGGFFVCALFSNLIGSGSFLMALVGLKGYFQMWGLMLAIAFLGLRPAQANRIMWFFVILALIQLPVALHQFIKLVPLRTGVADAQQAVVAVDIVAGTFGGQMHGGGRSTDSAILACIGIAVLASLWRAGRVSMSWFGLAAMFIMAPMALNEAKFVILGLPLALIVVFKDRIQRAPLQFFAGVFVTSAALVVMLIGYSLLPGARSQQSLSFDKYAEEMISSNFGEKGYGRAYLNRSTVYRHWFAENVNGERWQHALLGYGVGATNSNSQLGGGESFASQRYRNFLIGITGASSLLWEIGFIGFSVVMGLLCALYRLAANLVRSQSGTVHAPFLLAAQAVIPVFVLSMFVTNYFVFDLGYQAMFVTISGYLLCMSTALKEDCRVQV